MVYQYCRYIRRYVAIHWQSNSMFSNQALYFSISFYSFASHHLCAQLHGVESKMKKLCCQWKCTLCVCKCMRFESKHIYSVFIYRNERNNYNAGSCSIWMHMQICVDLLSVCHLNADWVFSSAIGYNTVAATMLTMIYANRRCTRGKSSLNKIWRRKKSIYALFWFFFSFA